ncbi:hypothetical protein [Accumulibacter sp.]
MPEASWLLSVIASRLVATSGQDITAESGKQSGVRLAGQQR